MGVNIVKFYGSVIVDMTDATVTPETLAEGVKAYDAKGNLITGTAKIQSGSSYTNLFKADTSLGYVSGAGFSSTVTSDSPSSRSGYIITNYIPVAVGQTLHVKGIKTHLTGGTGYAAYLRNRYYNASKTLLTGNQTTTTGSGSNATVKADYADDVFTYTMPAVGNRTDIAYVRISGALEGSVEDVVITVEEQII